MKRSLRPAFALSMAAAVLGLLGLAGATTTDPSKASGGKAAEPDGGRPRLISFTYEAFYESPPKDKQAFDFWIPLPMDGEGQAVKDLVIYSPTQDPIQAEPEYGNRMLHVFSGPRGGVPLKVTVKFNVERQEIRNPHLGGPAAQPPMGTSAKPGPAKAAAAAAPPNLSRYLEPDKLVPLDADTRALAAKVTQGKTTPVQKARAIYDYVIATMKYDKSGPAWGRGDLKYAMATKSGNCTDFNALFEGLARASGVPARQVTGFEIPRGPREGNLTQYHCWSEFYLDGSGWVPVDPVDGQSNPSRKDFYFGNLDADRIVYSLGRDVVLAPPQKGEPINFLLYPYAEADGELLKGAGYSFTWKDGKMTTFTLPPGATPVP